MALHPPSLARTLARLLIAFVVTALVLTSLPSVARAAGRTLYVATTGSDYLNDGYTVRPNSFQTPWRTITRAIREAEPGDTIVVRGGTYVEKAGWGARPGTADSPIVLTNYENERVVIKGHLQLIEADYWTVDGINVTHDPANGRLESLVKFDGGVGWQLLNSEIWGSRGVSNLMISGLDEPARDYRIAGNCIHDNLATGDAFMNDHNIYLMPGYDSGPGVIERNIFFNAPNGANIKAAGNDPTKTGAADVQIRFNTMATAGAGVLVAYGSHGIAMAGNLIGPQKGGGQLHVAGIIGNKVSGAGNVANNNAITGYEKTVWSTKDSIRPIAAFESARVQPDFDSITSCSGFHPSDATASTYGRFGDGNFPKTGLDTFSDDDGSIFENDIEWIAARGITEGCNPPLNNEYCPEDRVSRGQMAAFIRRALNLPASPRDYFGDDNSTTFEADINAMAHAGITQGCNPPANSAFCANDDVTRGQMAAFIKRALDLPASTRDYFRDDNSTTFEADINSLAQQGVARGCNPPANDHFCPGDPVLRDQMAAFLARALRD